MARAVWNGTVIAEATDVEIVESNIYFPPQAVRREHFRDSETTSVCPWKGTARYYTLEVGGEENVDAAWYYPEPKPAARNIAGYVAFWKGVEVER